MRPTSKRPSLREEASPLVRRSANPPLLVQTSKRASGQADKRTGGSADLTLWRPRGEDDSMISFPLLPVATWWVMQVMYAVQPSAPMHIQSSYGEISVAIANASLSDPLFTGDDGAYRTAALLIALAHHESHFQKNAVGDGNKSFGLFQIQPPTAKVDSMLLMLPANASLVAIDLIRTSMKLCAKRPLPERLAWYAQGRGACSSEEPSRQALEASRAIFWKATQIMMRHPVVKKEKKP